MVEDSGTKVGAGALRPLDRPQSTEVEADEKGWPVAALVKRRWLMAQIVDRWRIDDEWWRGQPVSRSYFAVVLEDGRRWTLFQDLVTGKWFRQN